MVEKNTDGKAKGKERGNGLIVTKIEVGHVPKILIKLSVKNKEDIPKGLRQEMTAPPSYGNLRMAEVINSGLDPNKIQVQRTDVLDTGKHKGKVPLCEVGSLFFKLLEHGKWVIEDAHYKDTTESENSKAKSLGSKSYPIFINLVPAGSGKEERLDSVTFNGIVRLLFMPYVVNLWDNSRLKKPSYVINLSQPKEYDENTPLKNKLMC